MPVDAPDARDQVHPCRPTISCTAEVVAPGRLEVESGAQSSVAQGASNVLAFPLLLELGLLRALELQVGSNGYTRVDATPQVRYLDNVMIGPKVHLLDQGDVVPSLSLSAAVGLPTFDATGYSRHDDAFATAYASKDVGSLHVDWNVGALFWGLDASPAVQAFTALALSPTLPPPLGVAIEGYYFSDAPPFANHDGGLRAYASVTARSWLVLDAGADAGFFPNERAFTVFLGVSIIPVVLWRPADAGTR